MTLEDLRGMRPERPAALDELDRFVGSWAWEGTMKMTGLDEPLKVSGKSEVKWAGDKWFLQIQESASIQELGNSEGTRIWSYDAKAKKFRSSWVDSMGTTMQGTTWPDEKSGTWQFRTTGYGSFGPSTARGTVRFPDPDTMEWDWQEFVICGLVKTVEITGTSKRIK